MFYRPENNTENLQFVCRDQTTATGVDGEDSELFVTSNKLDVLDRANVGAARANFGGAGANVGGNRANNGGVGASLVS